MPVRRCILACLVLLLATTALAQTEYETVRQPALRQLGARLQANQADEARQEIADYLAHYPGDAVMQYNLACMDALAGHTDLALARLDSALAAGYRNIDRFLTDPDLFTLADHPELAQRVEDAKADLVATMNSGAFFLEENIAGDILPLMPDRHGPGLDAAQGTVQFRYDQDALIAIIASPLDNADELLLIVALPTNLQSFETTRWFEFQADLAGPGSVTRLARHGRRDPAQDQGELISTDQGWELRIPWSSLHPYKPPVELLLGLNLVLRRLTDTAPADRWSLITDPFTASEVQPWRRYVPVDLDPGYGATAALVGRLDSYLVIGDSLSVELGIQGLPAGPVNLTVSSGPDATSLEPDTTYVVTLESDLSYTTVDCNLADLPPSGWFTLSMDMTTGEGTRYAWQDRGFRLPPDWFITQQTRRDTVPKAERSILDYQLFTILRGQQNFQPHDDPTPIAEAVLQAEALLDLAEANGSLLPSEAGIMSVAFPSGRDALQSCWLVLPRAELRPGAPLMTIFMADHRQRLALAQALEAQRHTDDPRMFMVATVPIIPGQASTSTPLVTQAMTWGQALLAPEAIQLVGVGPAAEVALLAAMASPDSMVGVMLLADRHFDPWALNQPQAPGRLVASTLGSMPLVLNLVDSADDRSRQVADEFADASPSITKEKRPALDDGPTAWAARLLNWD